VAGLPDLKAFRSGSGPYSFFFLQTSRPSLAGSSHRKLWSLKIRVSLIFPALRLPMFLEVPQENNLLGPRGYLDVRNLRHPHFPFRQGNSLRTFSRGVIGSSYVSVMQDRPPQTVFILPRGFFPVQDGLRFQLFKVWSGDVSFFMGRRPGLPPTFPPRPSDGLRAMMPLRVLAMGD